MELLPCPFCGSTDLDVMENRLSPTMNGRGAIISIDIRHHCRRPGESGVVKSSLHITGRDEAAAVAAWNKRA